MSRHGTKALQGLYKDLQGPEDKQTDLAFSGVRSPDDGRISSGQGEAIKLESQGGQSRRCPILRANGKKRSATPLSKADPQYWKKRAERRRKHYAVCAYCRETEALRAARKAEQEKLRAHDRRVKWSRDNKERQLANQRDWYRRNKENVRARVNANRSKVYPLRGLITAERKFIRGEINEREFVTRLENANAGLADLIERHGKRTSRTIKGDKG